VRTLNLGILAHVDAGKTSLTERLLFAAGVIDAIGRVDDGSTQTDSLALERQRGITIKSAVASFDVSGVTVNLIDTPGHPDFIAEVERVLSVLDGAVLVISAVEGVQPQTLVLMRALRRLGIPVLIFVNKIDRMGARPVAVVVDITARLAPAAIALGEVRDAGTARARVVPAGPDDTLARDRIASLLADHDDDFLAAYVRDPDAVTWRRLSRGLARLTRRGLASPVLFGSAMTGAGVSELTQAVVQYLPRAENSDRGPLRGTVFKVERGTSGEKVAYVRLFSGTITPRDRVGFGPEISGGDPAPSGQGKITAVRVAGHGPAVRGASAVPGDRIGAGQIGLIRGLAGVRIGDVITALDARPEPAPAQTLTAQTLTAQTLTAQPVAFAPPTLETVVVPRCAAEVGALHTALTQLAEQDPLINLRQDDAARELTVSLYGEVQKEVIEATLATDFGLAVSFRQTRPICVEWVTGTGSALEVIDQPPNPFLATVGLRVDPAPAGAGVRFRLGIELGALPFSFLRAIDETVQVTLGQGLRGWPVPDATVTLIQSGYWPRQSHMHGTFDASMSSTAGDFRHLTPLVLMTALRQAGTQVCEPVHRFRLEAPAVTFAAVLPALAKLGGIPLSTADHGPVPAIEGEIPAARVHDFQQQLPGLTHGEGLLDSAFDHYQPVRGAAPTRLRTDDDPLNRREYLLRVQRRQPLRERG
jgi:ribosomal protection tetracycline resistance protein